MDCFITFHLNLIKLPTIDKIPGIMNTQLNHHQTSVPSSSLTLLETLSQACLTRAWSTVSIPSFWVDCRAPSTCFLLISNWTCRLLNNWRELTACCWLWKHVQKCSNHSMQTVHGLLSSLNPWIMLCMLSFFGFQILGLLWIMCKGNEDILRAAEYGKYLKARWNKTDWLKIWQLLSDPHSVMPLIKLIIRTSVPSVPILNYPDARTHTHKD